MFCPNCGCETDPNAVFCKKCGCQLKMDEKAPAKKHNGKKKIVLGVAMGILLIASISIAGVYILKIQPEKKYARALTTGQKYMEEEQYEQAIDSYKEAIRISPKEIEPYKNLAKAYLAVDDIDHAEEIYNVIVRVIEDDYNEKKTLSEEDTDMYRDVINYYGEKGDTDKVNDLSDAVIDMLDKDEEKQEFEGLKNFYGMNWAYYNKLLELQEKYGEGEKRYSNNNFSDYLTGLCFAKLIDMNGDKQEELILIYGDQSSEESSSTTPAYTEEVWEYRDGQILNLYQGNALKYGDAMMATSFIINKNGTPFITTGYAGYTCKYNVYGYDNEQFGIVKTMESDFNLNCKVDDQAVSRDIFVAEVEEWTAKVEEYDLSCGTERENLTLQELNRTFSMLKERLKIGMENDTVTQKEEIQSNIPADAVQYNGHSYYLYELDNITSGEAAEKYCESLGGYLATVTSAEENQFLYDYISGLGYKNAHFGLTDSEQEGIWKWVTGEKVGYTNFHPGEPNGENEDEDYAMFYFKYEDGTWNDGDFNGRTVEAGNTFLCEWGCG